VSPLNEAVRPLALTWTQHSAPPRYVTLQVSVSRGFRQGRPTQRCDFVALCPGDGAPVRILTRLHSQVVDPELLFDCR